MTEIESNDRERIVHLGLLLPKVDRNPSTIYCILTPAGGNLVGMQITSDREYEVPNTMPNAVPIRRAGPYQRSSRFEKIDSYLSELATVNSAVIEDHCRLDGLELKARLSSPIRELRTDCSSKA